MRELLIWVRGRVHPALSQAAGSIALIAVWTTSSPALACLNGVELHRKQAVQLANAAEKAANIKIVDYRMIGATGRLYLSGTESEVRAAATAAEQVLEM